MNSVKSFQAVTAIFITVILLCIPFFWMKPDQLDIGGDSNRLYYYDPIHFSLSYIFYGIEPYGLGNVEPNYYLLPFIILLRFLQAIFHSSYISSSLINGLKLGVGFLAIYFIVKELLCGEKNETRMNYSVHFGAILAGLFYVFSTASFQVISQWGKAIVSHTQIFLNPLMFLLLLHFLLKRNNYYLYAVLILSFIFSYSFAVTSAPPFFAFYPFAVIFLILYVVLIRKQSIPWKMSIFGLFMFIGIQSFHLVPQIASLFDAGSFSNYRVFDKKAIAEEGVLYFTRVLINGKASYSFLVIPSVKQFQWLSVYAPIILIVGFLVRTKKDKTYLLTGVFFLLFFYLASANITNFGVEIYNMMFYIPGFSMFRTFHIQWMFVFIFVYALMLGQGISYVFYKFRKKYIAISFFLIALILPVEYWGFITGDLVNGIHPSSRNVRTFIRMDPQYEKTLDFLRSLPDDGKMLTLPLTDPYYQLIYDKENNSAYMGPSSIAFLTGKRDFAGFQEVFPFYEELRRYARQKNYDVLLQIFSIMNIHYIFYNTDPNVYEAKFPLFPYNDALSSLPKSQREYALFIKHFPVKLIYKNGPFNIYKLDNEVNRPEIYIPRMVFEEESPLNQYGNYTNLKFITKKLSYDSAFINESICMNNFSVKSFCLINYQTPQIHLRFIKHDPTYYSITINPLTVKRPFLLIFQNAYNQGWKVSLNEKKEIEESKHVDINGYANGWIIEPEDYASKQNIHIKLYLKSRNYFWYGLIITFISLFLIITRVLIDVAPAIRKSLKYLHE